MELPAEFCELMRQQYGDEIAERLFMGLSGEPSVSVRLNMRKAVHPLSSEHSVSSCNSAPSLQLGREESISPSCLFGQEKCLTVPWCPHAFYIPERPPFTFDPLFHAGVYYVQEASSMFLWHVLEHVCPQLAVQPHAIALDLCAAPGGKSTLLRSFLSPEAYLVSNEPIAKRAHILAENMTKWGAPNTLVTSNFPPDFHRQREVFDLIVCDVPCSGEGMFRKDEQAIREWSMQNVENCWQRQRQIIESIWPCLRPGGTLVYSTCTFNHFEDEDNVAWIAQNLGAEILSVPYDSSWGIVELQPGMMHFMPGLAKGEGFFITALRKEGEMPAMRSPQECDASVHRLSKAMRVVPMLESQLAMCTDYDDSLPRYALSYDEALAYLRHEALRFPPDVEMPRGQIVVSYRGFPLGLVKSVGNRANNLYPDEWRIRTTYLTPFTLFPE